MGNDSTHALLAPSSADRWMVCPGSILMEQGIPDVESDYAAEGTQAHKLAALLLTADAVEVTYLSGEASSEELSINGIQIPRKNVEHVTTYVNKIAELAKGHTLLVEQALPIGHITLEPGAEGTGDAIILHSDGETIEVNDLKFGMGVKVYAEKNKQMMLYALGALCQFAVLGNWKKVILRIHQPRLYHFDSWETTVEELEEFASEVTFRANFIWRLLKGEVAFNEEQDLCPVEKACRWCKAKATCPALAAHTLKVVAEDFVDIAKNPVAKLNTAMEKLNRATNQRLAWFMQNLGLIEDWVKAVRQKTEGELLAGHVVPGFKIVAGKKGNREWEDEKLVETELKAWRLKSDEMYKSKLISPSEAEKFFKTKPKKWEELKKHVVQEQGKPSVAPSTDPRPVLQLGAVEDDFSVMKE